MSKTTASTPKKTAFIARDINEIASDLVDCYGRVSKVEDRLHELEMNIVRAEGRKQVADMRINPSAAIIQDTVPPQTGPAKKRCKCKDKEEQHGPDFADGITIGLVLGVLLTVGSIIYHRRMRFTSSVHL